MPVISLADIATKPTTHSTALHVLRDFDKLSNTFTTQLQNQYNSYLSNLVLSTNTTWASLLKAISPNAIRPVIVNALRQLWNSGWNTGSEHGRKDLKHTYLSSVRSNFANKVNLITFAKTDDILQSLNAQINSLVQQQEDNTARLNQLNKDINNPDRYAAKRLSKSSLTDDERVTVVSVLTNQANAIEQQQQDLKQQQNALMYQLSKAANKDSVSSPKQLDMLSKDELTQIKAQRKLDKQQQYKDKADQKALQRQQDLLTPLPSNSSPLSQAVSDLRDQRIRESQITQQINNRLDTPIILKDETDFSKYLDKRYTDLADKLSTDTSNNAKQNIQQYIDNLSTTQNKLNTYLTSSKTSREKDLLKALSPMYPDYGKEARQILKETKQQRLTSQEASAVNDNITNLQRLIHAYNTVNNTAKVQELNEKLQTEQNKFKIQLSADQANRLGLGNKSVKISRQNLEQLSKKKSVLNRIKRVASTELSAAYNYGRFAHYRANNIKLVKWNVSVEHLRMNNKHVRNKQGKLRGLYTGQGVVCSVCSNLAENDIGYGPGVYPLQLFIAGQMLPPPNPHPHCACYLEPIKGEANKRKTVPQLAIGAILGGTGIASIALLNSMFNRTRGAVQPIALEDMLVNIARPVLENIHSEDEEINTLPELVELIHRSDKVLKLQAPPIISDNIQIADVSDQEIANNILNELERPINSTVSKYDTSSTISKRNSAVLSQGSRAIGNDISVLNKAQQLVRESENKRQAFVSRFEAAEGNARLQTALLTEYTKYISTLTKTINDLDISQIKLINSLNTAKTALEETKDTMQRYKVVEELSPGIVDDTQLINNTNTVRQLTDQANSVYNNIINTQATRQEYKDTLTTVKDSLLSNAVVANKYLEQKAPELNYLDTTFEDTKGVSNLATNLDTAQEYIDAVKSRIDNRITITPAEYDQSFKDIEAAQQQLTILRNATSDNSLDFNLLNKATQSPTITVNDQTTTLPFSQDQVVRVQSKFDQISNLEVDSNNLQTELNLLKNNSPQAKDQIDINPRQLDKAARLNELTRQMGSLIYEQQSLRPSDSRYIEINGILRDLNNQKQQITNAYFKQNLNYIYFMQDTIAQQ